MTRTPPGRWAEPDLDAAVDALRWVRANPEAARARAARQTTQLRARYAPDVVADDLLAAIARMGA